MQLNDRLTPDFITMRPYLPGEKCGGEYIWEEEKPFVALEPPAPAFVPRWMNWIIDAAIEERHKALIPQMWFTCFRYFM